MRYFGRSIVDLASIATVAALIAAPFFAFAQVGYGGGGSPSTGSGSLSGGNGPIIGLFPTTVIPQQPTPQVLGAFTENTGASTGSASGYFFSYTLSRGLSGEAVTELQRILIALGYLDIEEPTGYFGPLTETAVIAYQEANGLEGVGIVGPLTRALLNGTSSSTTSGNQALLEQLQQQLNDLVAQLAELLAQQQ
jgi:hypothetical protein